VTPSPTGKVLCTIRSTEYLSTSEHTLPPHHKSCSSILPSSRLRRWRSAFNIITFTIILKVLVPVYYRRAFDAGALMNGWTASLAPDDGEGYSVVRAFGKKVVETGTLGPRPAQAIEVFEYEGSPYCRKVREAAAVLDLARGFSRKSTSTNVEASPPLPRL